MLIIPLKDQNYHFPTYEKDQNALKDQDYHFPAYENDKNVPERPKLSFSGI
jgi:hypothetical protein